MDARKYWTACRVHDWFYEMSDDNSVYEAGRDNEDRLRDLANADPKLMEIYAAWREHHKGCGPVPKEPALED